MYYFQPFFVNQSFFSDKVYFWFFLKFGLEKKHYKWTYLDYGKLFEWKYP